MPYEYNTLLKLNLQKKADLDPVEADIDDLKQKKVSKFFAATDTLEAGEIAQYQGPDDVDNNLKNGYFYKSNGVPVIIEPPINKFSFTNDFPLNQPFNLGDYNFIFGNYYQVQNYNIESSIITAIKTYTFENRFVTLESPTINVQVFDRVNNTFDIITAIDNVNYIATTSSGTTINISSSSNSTFTDLLLVGNEAGNESFIFLYKNNGFYTLLVHWNFDNNSVIDWFPFQCLKTTRNTPYNYNTEQFQQVDTQQRVQGVENAQDGSLIITRDVQFSGDITVQGTQTVVKTQEIDSENDNINLRYNNPIALADGEESGVKVLNYDGNNTNCFLGVDNKGWARVGDEGGTLQKLATIEETPTDGQFVKYNTTTKQLESGTIPTPPEATTTDAGLMSAADKVKLDNLSVSAVTSYTKSNSTFKFYKYGRLVNVFIICNSTSSSPISLTIDAAFAPLEYVGAYGVPFMSSGSCSIEIDGTTLSFIGKGAICLSYLAAS